MRSAIREEIASIEPFEDLERAHIGDALDDEHVLLVDHKNAANRRLLRPAADGGAVRCLVACGVATRWAKDEVPSSYRGVRAAQLNRWVS